MNQVELTPDGRLTAQSRDVSDQPLHYLGCELQMAKGCSLRTFFRLLDHYAIFTRLGDFYQLLSAQYDQCPQSDCLWPEADRLEFFKTVEMIGYPGKPRLEIYHTLHGISPGASREIRHLPLQVLLDMPLELGPLKHLVFGDRMDTMEFETVYTLFEFIDGMAWALSFHGTPAQCPTRS